MQQKVFGTFVSFVFFFTLQKVVFLVEFFDCGIKVKKEAIWKKKYFY